MKLKIKILFFFLNCFAIHQRHTKILYWGGFYTHLYMHSVHFFLQAHYIYANIFNFKPVYITLNMSV